MSRPTTKLLAASLVGAMSFALIVPALARAQAPAAPANPAPGAGAAALPQAEQPAAAPDAQDGLQVLEQGPVHEAFAEPVVLEAADRVKVDRAPPDPVNEVPPEVRPEGDNVEWISGYWMWSDQQNDYIWVSGVWREIPPGRRWVPGHWAKADAGFEWVSGFWAAQQVQEVQMLPKPPETLEVGPSSPAPAANYFWVPGIWVWQNGGYGWRAGYWYAGQANWIWIPDRYCYTPRGAIFVSGYWDYPLVERGLLYAPVFWSRPLYTRPGYFYRPYSVVNTGLLLSALFINNRHCHYYYGYGGWGGNQWYRPWWSNSWGRGHGYDPFYAYHRWHDGRNRDDWHDHVRRDWDHHHHNWDKRRRDGDWDRHDHDGPGRGRPDNIAGRPGGDRGHQLVENVNDFRRNEGRELGVKLRDATPQETQAALKRSENWKQIREARVAAEAKAGAGGAVNVGAGDTADASARVRGRGPDGKQLGTVQPGGRGNTKVDGDTSGQLGSTGPGEGRRLRVDTPEGTPRGSFRLPPVERSTGAANAVGTGGTAATSGAEQARRVWENSRVGTPGGGSGSSVRTLPGSIGGNNTPSVGNPGQLGAGSSTQRGQRQFEPNSGSKFEPRVTYPSRGNQAPQFSGENSQFRRGSSPPTQQGGSVAIPGGARITVPQGSTSPGRSFRYNPGNTAGQGQPSFQGGGPSGQPSMRIPSGMQQRSYRGPSSDGGQRSFSVPSGGGQPSFRGNPGGGQPSFRGSPGGGQRSIQIPSGGGGGDNAAIRSGGGGGGGHMSRGGGGGGGGNRGGGRGRGDN